ncbi:MAG TPA: PKD domain-containing protein [Planctomycetota bacterium]
MLRTAALAFALPLLGALPPAVGPTANPPVGVGPLTVTFSSIPAGGVLYEWDFDFLPAAGFTPDYTDVVAGDVTTSYAAIGLYTARLLVTDDVGAQTPYDVLVTVAPASGPPAVQVAIPTINTAFGTVAATAEAEAAIGASITLYEWDVENDGVFDQSGAALASITFTGGDYGSYTANLRVTDDQGRVTSALQGYDIRPPTAASVTPDPDPPSVTAFSATTAGVTTNLLPLASSFNARVGDLVTFNATASAGIFGVMRFFRFDFDGRNGAVQFDRTVPATLALESVSATHHYDTPGTYTVTLRVQDTENFVSTRTATVNVSVEPGVFKTWLFQPRNGQRVFGDAVTIRAKTFPTSQTASVTFKYRAVSGGAPPPPSDPSWTTIKTVTPPPFTFLSATWDVTALPPGDYDLAAVAARTLGGSADSLSNERVVVTVDSAAPEILENVDTHLAQGIDPNRNESSGLSGDVIVDIPAGSTPAYDQMRVQRRSVNPHPLEARLQGLNFVQGHFRRINFDGGLENLFVPSRVTFYVSDTDGDGLVDGQPFSKAALKVYRFNPLLKAWQPLGEQVLQPQEDLVRASLTAVGDVGIAAEFDNSRSPSGSSSDCGLLGLEAVLLLALLRRRRC